MTSTSIPLFQVHLPPASALMPRLEQTLYSGQISEGPVVYAFEDRFASFIAMPGRALSFYSGTAALHAALLLAGVQPGDEVISTAMTAEPTNMAILHAGAVPLWADVDPRNGNLDPESIAASISDRTRAIVVVHYGGIPAAMTRVRAVAAAWGIPVIEDVAHALGATCGGRQVGWQSEYAVFSLQAIKHMTTVDGGMLVCGREGDLHSGRLLRWFGIDREACRTSVSVETIGYKYHMNNVNATIGLVQLDYIQPVLARHIANGRYFDRELSGIPGLSLCSWEAEAQPSYWFYTLLADDAEGLSRKLAGAGIASSKVHKRNDLHPVFRSSRRVLPALDSFFERMLHIPCGWWVSDEDRERIAATIRGGW